MVLGIHIVDDTGEDTLLIEYEGFAQRTVAETSAELFLAPCAERLNHFGRGIGQQWERQLVVLCKTLVRFGRVFAYAVYLIAGGLESMVVVTQIACFGSATGVTVFRLEIEFGFLSEKAVLRNGFAILIHHLKRWHTVSNL